jgi:hypothetical protein
MTDDPIAAVKAAEILARIYGRAYAIVRRGDRLKITRRFTATSPNVLEIVRPV